MDFMLEGMRGYLSENSLFNIYPDWLQLLFISWFMSYVYVFATI